MDLSDLAISFSLVALEDIGTLDNKTGLKVPL